MSVFSKILDYFKYPSTWQGLIGIATAAGLTLSPEQTQAIITAAVALAGAVALFFSDADVEK